MSDWISDVSSSDLFCVATNLVMELARRRHVRDRHEQDAYLEQVMPEPEPEHAATAQQALRILSLSIAGMPDRRRLAFERFVFADRTAGQVATEMGVSVKMIEKHVAQARAYCRQMLRSEEHTSDLQSLMRISYAV